MASTLSTATGPVVGRTALTGVRVFDGQRLTEPRTVVIDGAMIGSDSSGAREIDTAGAVLLPGLIDAHIHLHGRDTLRQLVSHGVTTGLDMATWPRELLDSLRGVEGVTDIRSAGLPAIGPAGPHTRIPGMPSDAIVLNPEQARRFAAARVAEGVDYLKVVAEAPGQGGPDQATIDALVAAAHARGLKVVVHAASVGAFTMALDSGADVITHAPLDQPLPEAQIGRMAAGQRIAVPTLITMQAHAAARPGTSFAAATDTVAALHAAGVTILAGSDAVTSPGMPVQVPHGESLHQELELLVAAGLSSAEALCSATSLPAQVFGLHDRGAVELGLRADLVLIDGDPLKDIRATRNIRRIWCGGVEHAPDERRDPSANRRP
jgi:imidazolonepropionase-like amidohydrolase